MFAADPHLADNMFGRLAHRAQPDDVPAPSHAPGEPEPMARTEPRPGQVRGLDNPALVLVGLVAVAILILQLVVRGGD